MLHKIKKIFFGMKRLYPSLTFKIVEICGEPHNKNVQVTYQVSGKATTVTEKPSTIVNELLSLKGFSEEDANIIYNLAITEKHCPSLRIISIIYADGPTKFEIEDIHSKLSLQLTAENLITCHETLRKFSHDDVTKIYFQYMLEQVNLTKAPRDNKQNFQEDLNNNVILKLLGPIK